MLRTTEQCTPIRLSLFAFNAIWFLLTFIYFIRHIAIKIMFSAQAQISKQQTTSHTTHNHATSQLMVECQRQTMLHVSV